MEKGDGNKPGNLHTCKLCSYRSESTFVKCKHVKLHRTRAKIETFACDSKALEMFECKFCVFETNLKVDLAEHVRVVHEGKESNEEMENIRKCYCCENCDFDTHSILVSTAHVNSCKAPSGNNSSEERGPKDVKWFQCEQCTFKSKVENEFKVHIIRRHTSPEDIRWIQCERCEHQTKTKAELRKHMLTHTKIESINWHQCEHCEYKAKRKHCLKTHIKNRHTKPEDIKWFHCEQCDYKAKRKDRLESHNVTKHLNSRSFQCGVCPYKANTKYGLKSHNLWKHTNPDDIEWFPCEQCWFQTKTKTQLKLHMLTHINPETINGYQCEHCEYKAKTKCRLESHNMAKHVNSRSFHCEKCPYKANTKHDLKKHNFNKHTNPDIKWLKCGQCAYQAT